MSQKPKWTGMEWQVSSLSSWVGSKVAQKQVLCHVQKLCAFLYNQGASISMTISRTLNSQEDSSLLDQFPKIKLTSCKAVQVPNMQKHLYLSIKFCCPHIAGCAPFCWDLQSVAGVCRSHLHPPCCCAPSSPSHHHHQRHPTPHLIPPPSSWGAPITPAAPWTPWLSHRPFGFCVMALTNLLALTKLIKDTSPWKQPNWRFSTICWTSRWSSLSD